MNWDNVIGIIILLLLIFLIYSSIKKQSMRETYNEIKELISPTE